MKLKIVGVIALGCLVTSGTAYSSNPCTSQWMKASKTFKKLEPIASNLACIGVGAIATPAAGLTCISMYNKGKTAAKAVSKQYQNINTGSAHIGPRGCAYGIKYKGTVLSERVFNCVPAEQRRVTVDFKITGGKGKKPLTVNVCFIKPNGQLASHKVHKFNGAKKSKGKGFKTTFKGKAGLIPMIYLHKQTGVNGYKYTLRTTLSGGEPKSVSDARKIAKK